MSNSGHNEASENEKPLRRDADKGREPQLIPGRMGTRLYSQAALLERIEAAFYAEHGDDSALLREAHTQAQRLRLVLDTADYVLAVESVQLSQDEKAALVRRAHSDLFGYGPLDAHFADARVTTIALDGVDKAAVRYGHGELVSLGTLFDDEEHMRRILNRLLMHAGAELRDDQPIIETGLRVHDRPVSMSLAAPPAAFQLTADIRVHPTQQPTLEDLVARGVMTTDAATFLRALAASPYGLMIVGEGESGKTTLLGALAAHLSAPAAAVLVDRAGEMRLPPGMERLTVRWSVGDESGATFGQQISAALEREPAMILLDEVRADDPTTIAPLLEYPAAPRQWWTFRGAPDAKRLQSALGMLARRAALGGSEALVFALYDRLPFVVTLVRVREQIQLFSIGEWQPRTDSDYPDYVLLYQYQDGVSRPTGRNPSRAVAAG